MYKYAAPLMLQTLTRYGADKYIQALQEMRVERVFLALDCYETDEEKRKQVFVELEKYCRIFQNAGFEVGAWIWTFMVKNDTQYTRITGPNGVVSTTQMCPSDDAFCDFAKAYIADIARCKPDLIMFDDDFRYGMLDCGVGCVCKNHLAYMSNIVGEELSADGIADKLLVGGENKYRSAWLSANAYYFKRFAKYVREAVDSVDKTIRLGNCACMSTWDYDGVSAYEISKILAGETKPFMRLIGAPYWAALGAWGNRLQDTIETERMERAWCDDGIEIFAEGDAFPRPRYTCPASYLENFDQAIRVLGITDGILKYTFDYSAPADYEQGYNRYHLKNFETYKRIDALYKDKTVCGIRVYEQEKKFEKMEMPDYYCGSTDVQLNFFSIASRMCTACSLPTVYENTGIAGVAFGENARYLDTQALQSGLMLDIVAAKILQESGVDVGLGSVGDLFTASEEYYENDGIFVRSNGVKVHKIMVAKGANVQSYCVNGDDKTIGSYLYENANGQRFLVFAFDGGALDDSAYRNYARAKQLASAVEWLSGKTLPVKVFGCPDLYVIAKRNDNALAVWAGNYHADEEECVKFVLDKEYSEIECINANCTLQGNIVTVDKIPAFGSVGFVMKN